MDLLAVIAEGVLGRTATFRIHTLAGDHRPPLRDPPSGGLPIIIIQHSAQPLAALYDPCRTALRRFLHDETVVQALVVWYKGNPMECWLLHQQAVA
jgi:hypothetical protein